jgi:hypothetical protein
MYCLLQVGVSCASWTVRRAWTSAPSLQEPLQRTVPLKSTVGLSVQHFFVFSFKFRKYISCVPGVNCNQMASIAVGTSCTGPLDGK